MATIGTRLYTILFGKRVGQDQFGNVYYTLGKKAKEGRTKRWVMYNGLAEPSKVPALWHAWLHYTTDIVPDKNTVHHAWEKEHRPNLTGTAGAYFPPGDIRRGAVRDVSTSDYAAWTPRQKGN